MEAFGRGPYSRTTIVAISRGRVHSAAPSRRRWCCQAIRAAPMAASPTAVWNFISGLPGTSERRRGVSVIHPSVTSVETMMTPPAMLVTIELARLTCVSSPITRSPNRRCRSKSTAPKVRLTSVSPRLRP